MLAAGYLGTPFKGSTDMTGTAAQTYDYLTGAALDTNTYYQNSKMGHIFCGL